MVETCEVLCVMLEAEVEKGAKTQRVTEIDCIGVGIDLGGLWEVEFELSVSRNGRVAA